MVGCESPSELNSQTQASSRLANRLTMASLVGSASALKLADSRSNSFGLSGGAPGAQQVTVASLFIDIDQCITLSLHRRSSMKGGVVRKCDCECGSDCDCGSGCC